jgi:hypothetical protein
MQMPTPTMRGVEDAPPPFDITLPGGWDSHFIGFGVLRPNGDEMDVKVAYYFGPVDAEHEAVITVLWDYPTIYEDVWRDGIELISVVFDPTCQFNLIDTQPDTYMAGIHFAEGVSYTVVKCETEPDVYGWLVGYRRAEVNYLFYVRITPVEGAQEQAASVQAIMDTIRFPGEE